MGYKGGGGKGYLGRWMISCRCLEYVRAEPATSIAMVENTPVSSLPSDEVHVVWDWETTYEVSLPWPTFPPRSFLDLENEKKTSVDRVPTFAPVIQPASQCPPENENAI